MEIRENGFRYITQNNAAILISADGVPSKNPIIPENIHGTPVVEIFDYAFQHSNIETISIPETVKRIRTGAFFYCENLTRVNIFYLYSSCKANRFLDIDSLAFGGCSNLREFSAPETLINLQERAFVDCKKIKNLTGQIQECENGALYNCQHLQNIIFSDKATIKRNSLFHNYDLQKIEFRGNADIDESVMKYILDLNCTICCTRDSDMANLAYDGYKVKIVK